jgi:hypothetical protein
MANELWIVLLVLAVFAVYVAAKVIGYMRQSATEWQQVDKSKLKKWEDED